MVQVIKSSNPKTFERVVSDLQKNGWWLAGGIKTTSIKGKQHFEAKMIKYKKDVS